MSWNIVVFRDSQGKDILNSFSESLNSETTAKITRFVEILEQRGPFLHMPFSKKITAKIHELRIRGKQEIRIFYTFKTNNIYILHVFQKKTQKTPNREIDIAKKRLCYLNKA